MRIKTDQNLPTASAIGEKDCIRQTTAYPFLKYLKREIQHPCLYGKTGDRRLEYLNQRQGK